MTQPPRDRDALIEVMARAIWRQMLEDKAHPCLEVCVHWPCGCAQLHAASAIDALESSGVFIGPVVATEEMCWEVNDDFLDAEDATDVWAAMQSANPYRKDHTNDRG